MKNNWNFNIYRNILQISANSYLILRFCSIKNKNKNHILNKIVAWQRKIFLFFFSYGDLPQKDTSFSRFLKRNFFTCFGIAVFFCSLLTEWCIKMNRRASCFHIRVAVRILSLSTILSCVVNISITAVRVSCI